MGVRSRFARMASRRVPPAEPRFSAFWYQVRAFSTSAPSPATPSFANTMGSYVPPNATAASASPASAAPWDMAPDFDTRVKCGRGGTPTPRRNELLALFHEKLDLLRIKHTGSFARRRNLSASLTWLHHRHGLALG